jgi:hypothetical protein
VDRNEAEEGRQGGTRRLIMCSEGQLLSQMNGWRSEMQRSDFVSRRGRGVACDKSDGDWNCQEELDK